MKFRFSLKYSLVKLLKIANKEADALISSGRIKVDNIVVNINITIETHQSIELDDKIIREGKELRYILLNKPPGIEATLNVNIPNNILDHFPELQGLYPIGRLDKQSEGILLFTNDGSIYDKLLRKEFNIQKEYIVQVDKPIDTIIENAFVNGIPVLGQVTLPAVFKRIDNNCFSVVLKQGLNRQIRRICYKCNYSIVSLKRVRFYFLELCDLPVAHYRTLTTEEIKKLKSESPSPSRTSGNGRF